MELINILNTATKSTGFDIKFMKNMSHRHEFRFKYENGDLNRILFYNNFRLNETNGILKWCNGLICERVNDKWVVVCWPLPAFERVKAKLTGDFTITPVHDATVVNVYYSHRLERWQIGSKRAFDLLDKTWRDVAYEELLSTIVDEFHQLDKDYTYIYAIKDPRIHIYMSESYVKLLAKTKMDTIERFEQPLELSLSKVFHNAKNSINLKKGETPCFGYILHNNEHTYLVESSLMKAIRNILYAPTFSRDEKNKYDMYIVKMVNDINYIKIRAYFEYRDQAILMFPQFADTFERMNILIRELIEYLINGAVKPPTDFELFEDKMFIRLKHIKNRSTQFNIFNNLKNFIFECKNITTFVSLI